MNDKLIKIQNELSVPKNHINSFGGYNYRSCEDILEAVKPLLNEEKILMTITDEVVQVGDRNYVKSTVKLIDDKTSMEFSAYAREEETKKGMDGSQITGASSSYARKYALNGLFLIDDVKDSDTTNTHENTQPNSTKSQTSDVNCPKCGGEMWDNTKNKINPKAPDYKCKDKSCAGVIWPPKDDEREDMEEKYTNEGNQNEISMEELNETLGVEE